MGEWLTTVFRPWGKNPARGGACGLTPPAPKLFQGGGRFGKSTDFPPDSRASCPRRACPSVQPVSACGAPLLPGFPRWFWHCGTSDTGFAGWFRPRTLTSRRRAAQRGQRRWRTPAGHAGHSPGRTAHVPAAAAEARPSRCASCTSGGTTDSFRCAAPSPAGGACRSSRCAPAPCNPDADTAAGVYLPRRSPRMARIADTPS